MQNRNIFFIPVIFFIAILSSCSIERKLAEQFVLKKDSISVLLLPPDFVFKTNLKTWMIEDFEQLTASDQDRLLYDSSKFLQFIDDTIFMGRYFGAIESALRKYGVQAYSQNEIIEFMDVKSTAYQIHLAQIEIEEGIYPYRAEEIFYDSVLFYEDFDLNQVSVNSWFEISKLNDTRAVNNVLFASDNVIDELEGRFTSNIFTGEVKFKYNIYPMKVENVYTLAAILGERYAAYIFDYMMNQYVYLNFPKDKQPDSYLSYDVETGVFYPAGDYRFVFIEE